jgi:hypothetical protein
MIAVFWGLVALHTLCPTNRTISPVPEGATSVTLPAFGKY